MAFELKHFTPEQLAKLSVMNPNLYKDLGMTDNGTSDANLLEALKLNTDVWEKLEKVYKENTEAYQAYLEAKKGKPVYEKGEILAALLFFCLLLVLI